MLFIYPIIFCDSSFPYVGLRSISLDLFFLLIEKMISKKCIRLKAKRKRSRGDVGWVLRQLHTLCPFSLLFSHLLPNSPTPLFFFPPLLRWFQYPLSPLAQSYEKREWPLLTSPRHRWVGGKLGGERSVES